MGWSEEVHARRLLDVRERHKKEKAAGPFAVPEVKGNAGSFPLILVAGKPLHGITIQQMQWRLAAYLAPCKQQNFNLVSHLGRLSCCSKKSNRKSTGCRSPGISGCMAKGGALLAEEGCEVHPSHWELAGGACA